MLKYILFLVPLALSAQTAYVAQRTSSLSGAAESLTVQQASSNRKTIKFVAAYIDCSVACVVTLSRDGNPASSTSLTTAAVNGRSSASSATAWRSSNVGTGTTLSVVSLTAGGSAVFDLSLININSNEDQGKNLTVSTDSITGTVHVLIQWTEQ